MKYLLTYLTIILSVLFLSCSKDKDNRRPSISVSSPYHMQNINGLDTIQIRATVNDDRNIESIKVSLRDADNNIVLSSISKSPNTTDYDLNELFFFDDIHLISGVYTFNFKVSDGENLTVKGVEIYLDEHPKTRNGIFIADNNGSSTNITYLDNSLNASYYNSYTGDFLAIGLNAFGQQLIITPQSTGNINAIDLNSGSPSWNDGIVSDFKSFLIHENNCYIGLADGNIKNYNSYGAFSFYGNSNSGYYMESAAIHENYFVVEEKAIAGSNVQLIIKWLPSGVQTLQAVINEDILGIYSLNPNTIILLTNNTNPAGNLIYYDIPTGLTSSPFSINTGNIDACVEIQSGIYLVAENGDLTTINAGNYSTSLYLNSINANQLKYDYLTNELFVVNGNQLTVYDYSSKSVKGNYTHSSNILDIEFWYNK